MKIKFQNKLNKLEKNTNRIFDLIQNLSDEKVNQKPSQNEWSIAEVMAHLIQAESLSVQYINKKKQDPSKLEKNTLMNKIKAKWLVWAFYLPFKYKAPALVNHFKSEYILSELIQDWKKTRNQLKAIFENIDPKIQNKNLFKHPFAGRLNLAQMLDFMNIHIKRHTKQIEKLI